MVQRDISEEWDELEQLKQGVSEGIGDMGFKARK